MDNPAVLPALATHVSGPADTYQRWSGLKRCFDVVASSAALIACLPVLTIVSILIKLTSRGPVLYRQTRCGQGGERFTILKFRSMVEGADEMRDDLKQMNVAEAPLFKIQNDPRVNRLGRVLRRTSLDELPQLWNVLQGDMSLVGPRPAMPSEVSQYDERQMRRLEVKPGLTGLWQVNGRSLLSFAEWVELDLRYVDRWSPALDLVILIKTVPAVISGKGAW